MICTRILSRIPGVATAGLLGLSVIAAPGARGAVVQTNRTEHWETNVIEIKMQATKLVTEYRTNWVNEVWNNIIDVYATNRVTKLYTNRIKVDLLQTNFVTAYHTNLQTLRVTNEVTRFITNRVAVEAWRTNFVQAYQTNTKTLHLTNWVTVLQFKTNWVTQPLTNLVGIDMPVTHGDSTAGSQPSPAAATHASSASSPGEPLALQARRTGQGGNGKPEVQLSVHATNSAGTAPKVEQWRVEREDGSMLLFGQDQEFRRALPVGKYKIEVKARQPGANQLVAALGTLSVLPEGSAFGSTAATSACPASW